MKRSTIIIILILSTALCLVMASAVMAQQRTPRTPESRVEEIENAITLTDDQRAQILKLYTDAAANMGQGGGFGGGGFGGRGGTADLEGILTAEQIKKLNAYNLQQSVESRITQIDEAVSLTDDQRKKIVPIIEKEVTATNAVTEEMRTQGQNADFQGMMEKRQTLRDETEKALQSILTEEQMVQYNAMPRGGGRGGMGGM